MTMTLLPRSKEHLVELIEFRCADFLYPNMNDGITDSNDSIVVSQSQFYDLDLSILCLMSNKSVC